MATPKTRIDQLLVDRGLAESRSKAQALIMAGAVYSDQKKLDKPGHQVSVEIPLTVRAKDHPWVSRGGLKLEHGLEHFGFDPTGEIAIDVGASTGGFTDVLLHNGTAKVYAVDVGYGQLDSKLRSDERVIVLERLNARYLTQEHIPEPIDIVVCDASFIGLRTVLPAAMSLTQPHASLIALIKPQFEVGKERVGKKGVVRDSALHDEVCDTIAEWMSQQPGWSVCGITESPITGPEGNKEFLIGARRNHEGCI
ncbi:MAG: TlyA family RNA methyltransferase [Rhodospirillaceae bacterium]